MARKLNFTLTEAKESKNSLTRTMAQTKPLNYPFQRAFNPQELVSRPGLHNRDLNSGQRIHHALQACTHLDQYSRLVVGVGGEGLGLLGGDGGVALDKGSHDTTGSLNAQRQWGNVQQQQVLNLFRLVSVQNGSLHSWTQKMLTISNQCTKFHFHSPPKIFFKNLGVAQTSKEGIGPSSKREFLWWKPRMYGKDIIMATSH